MNTPPERLDLVPSVHEGVFCIPQSPQDKIRAVQYVRADLAIGELERVMDEISQHDREHPDHGVGCACHDRHAGRIRKMIIDRKLGYKSLRNFLVVLGYVQNSPPIGQFTTEELNTPEYGPKH